MESSLRAKECREVGTKGIDSSCEYTCEAKDGKGCWIYQDHRKEVRRARCYP
jgi:hypothetical protein